MGILNRFTSIMSANFNALLDKCEDPSKMVDQYLRECRDNLADVKKETAAVMADEKAAKRDLDECQAAVNRYSDAAMKAVQAGNDDDARKLLSAKQAEEAKLPGLQSTYQMATDNAGKLRQMHDQLVNQINEMEARKDAIKAKIKVAEAQKKVNKITDGSKASEASIAAFDRMGAKADKMLDQAMAEAELNKGDTSAQDLAAKYAAGTDASVEDELAKLKASMQKN